MSQIADIDDLDKDIISILIKDAKTAYTDIAKRLIVSPGTVHVRMKKLEQLGVVQGSFLKIDPAKLGYDLVAFLGVHLRDGSQYNDVIEDLKKIPQVVEAYYTTGQYGIFVKIICKNTQHMREVLNEGIQSIDGIVRTETFISLEESIHRQVPVK